MSDIAVDLVLHVEESFDATAEQIWPYVLHWTSFVDENDFMAQSVTATPDTEGEVKRVSALAHGRVESTFLLTVLKIVPNRMVVYKLTSPDWSFDADTGAVTETPQSGYELMSLREEGGKTVVMLDVLAESRPTGVTTQEQAQKFAADYAAFTDDRWRTNYFPRLRELLAGA
jgi:hypothetical protein